MTGIYSIKVSTPMGQQNGTLSFTEINEKTSGELHFLGYDSPIGNVTVTGNNLEFIGTHRYGLDKFSYRAEASIHDDILDGTVKTEFGLLKVTGKRT